MSNSPLVSVMALCYNHSSFVIQALDSVLNQTYKNIELIIIDDNSTDGSQEIIENWIKEYKEECTFIKHKVNRTIGYSYNEFLRLAKGKFISSISTDDFFEPSKTEKQLEAFRFLDSDFGIIYSDLNVVDKSNNVLNTSFYDWYMGEKSPPSGNLLEKFIYLNPVQVTGTLVKREVYNQVGPYDESMAAEDWDMGFRWARLYKFQFFPEVLASYRISNSQYNAVLRKDTGIQYQFLMTNHKMFLKHLDLEKNIRVRIIEQLQKNYIYILSNKHSLRAENKNIAKLLFNLNPSIKSLVLLLVVNLNLSFLFLATISLLNRFSLFFRNRVNSLKGIET